MDVGIVARKGSERAVSLAATLRDVAVETDAAVWLDAETAEALDAGDDARRAASFDDCDLLAAVGGDGTFLFAARNAADTPIVGVNLGEVGFLNAVSPGDAAGELRAAIRACRDGALTVREVPRIAASAGDWTSAPAANEMVVQGGRRGPGGGFDYEVRVDGSRYSGGHADGILVATPTGSTAYNLSERGPLVHPAAGGLVVNEMVADDGMPPLVVDADAAITVAVSDPSGATVVGDGRNATTLDGPVEVTVERTALPIRIAGPPSDFFEALGKLS